MVEIETQCPTLGITILYRIDDTKISKAKAIDLLNRNFNVDKYLNYDETLPSMEVCETINPTERSLYWFRDGARHRSYGPAIITQFNKFYWIYEGKGYYSLDTWLKVAKLTPEEKVEIKLKYA